MTKTKSVSVEQVMCYCMVFAGDRELIQEVLYDAVVTAPLEAYWTGLALNKSE